MSRIKAGVKAVAARLGLTISKRRHDAFPALAGVPRYIQQEVKLLGHPFLVSDAASFLSSYREIFQDEIYRFDCATDVPTIIDCGANYGVSVCFFKLIYPSCRIKAVEADPQIYEVLRENILAARLEGVELINRAVSDSNDPLTFYSEGADAGRAHMHEGASGQVIVDGVTLDELIDGPVDFLKVDIEGAETKAFRCCTKLSLVQQLFIEYHSFAGHRQSLAELLKILTDHGFKYYIRTQFCSPRPLTLDQVYMGMDMQLNIFAKRFRPETALAQDSC